MTYGGHFGSHIENKKNAIYDYFNTKLDKTMRVHQVI